MRLGVREGGGFPPFTMGAMRFLAAGALLLMGAALARQRLTAPARDVTTAGVTGVLMWVGGNGLVLWAEQRAASGYAAVVIGTTPIWVALVESIVDRRAPSLLLIVSLLMGLAGLALLTAPSVANTTAMDVLSAVALLLASINWGLGSVWQHRHRVAISPVVSSGYQQLFAGLVFVGMAAVFHEPTPAPTPEAWWALAYLTVFGSVLAYTSFLLALRMLPAGIVMTYAYVNPIGAVFLGWLILHESLTAWTLAGTMLAMLGVAGVFRDRSHKLH